MNIRILAALLAGILLVFALASCSQGAAPASSIPDELPASAEESSSQVEPKPEPKPEPSVSESSEPAEPESEPASSISEAPPPEPEPDDGTLAMPPLDKIQSMYARSPSGYTYVGNWQYFDENTPADDPLKVGFALFEGLEPAADEKIQIAGTEFLIWTNDGIRHVYGLTSEGNLVADGKAYVLPPDRLDGVKQLHQNLMTHWSSYTYPQWLVWMTLGKIEKMIFHSPDRGARVILQDPDVHRIAASVAKQSVIPGQDSTYKPGTLDFSGKRVFHLEIRFTGGVVYNIYTNDRDYYVESSDMPFACRYRIPDNTAYAESEWLIADFEYIADAKSAKDLENPVT